MRVALATDVTLPDLDLDSQLLIPELAERGVVGVPVVWDDPDIDWQSFNACVIRSTWDYVPRYGQFMAWINRVELATDLWNPADIIDWNTRKTYMKDLEARGVAIVPTDWFDAGNSIDWEAVLAKWPDVVAKPVVGASGADTHRVTRDNLETLRPQLDELISDRDVMIQPFMKTVATHGEHSYCFFEGEYSHAVAKRPHTGEFRVQEHLGGQTVPYDPTPELVESARQILHASVDRSLLYARVDVMFSDSGQMLLSELELVEPSMFMRHDASSPARFAEAIARRLSTKPMFI